MITKYEKVPADCQHGTVSSTASLTRTSTNRSTISKSLSILYVVSWALIFLLASSVVQPSTPSSFVSTPQEEEESYPVARVIFDFVASSEFELSVQGMLGVLSIVLLTLMILTLKMG